ncbi:DUF4183 domain-containing protein [Neobacillus mesonae]|uniref:DUF4183 domain-containing protein n=1 Tax=Neobacillus mesonae TaxID=1193713 RepID=UPI002E243410|nr:DUF4183 domain-containing protein [Neobacillus mesonae]
MSYQKNKKHNISVPMVYDWVRSTSCIQIKLPLTNSPEIIKTNTYHYHAISDGEKLVYTDKDELKEYGGKGILGSSEYSYVNLFINGMLQPPSLYDVQKGRLTLKSQDSPKQGVLIILQFIIIFKS